MAAGSIERVTVVLQAFTARFNKGLAGAQKQLKTVGKNIQGFGSVMAEPLDRMKKMDKRFRGMNTSGGKLAFGMRKLTHGTRGFRMEMLGVMFFGMALQRIFTGLTRTALEWMGTTEILTSALGLLFLPLAEMMTDWVLIFLDWVGTLSEAQKKWIGWLVFAIGILGLFIGAVGTLALGVGSLILVFGGFGAAIAMMALIGVLIGGLGVIVTGVINLIQGKLEGIGLVIMGIGIVLFALIGWWALIPIAVGAAVFLIIRYWDKVIGALKTAWNWIKKVAKIWWDFQTGSIGKVTNFLGLTSFQTGGVIPETGPYMLHKGETVTPAGRTNTTIAPTINISATIANDYDVRRVAEELKRYWVLDFERASQGRTV